MAGQVVVTGGAGCIGLAICRRILAAGQTPVALDLAPAIAAVDWDSAQARGIVPLAGDVTDRASIEAAALALNPAEPIAGLIQRPGRGLDAGPVRDVAGDRHDAFARRALPAHRGDRRGQVEGHGGRPAARIRRQVARPIQPAPPVTTTWPAMCRLLGQVPGCRNGTSVPAIRSII